MAVRHVPVSKHVDCVCVCVHYSSVFLLCRVHLAPRLRMRGAVPPLNVHLYGAALCSVVCDIDRDVVMQSSCFEGAGGKPEALDRYVWAQLSEMIVGPCY